MVKVIAICNRKGGVGKTTLTCNIGVGLAVLKKKKVLLIDTDPQGDLSSSLGIDNVHDLKYTLAYCIEQEINDEPIEFDKVIIKNNEGVDILPCNNDLSDMDYVLLDAVGRDHILSNIIENVKKMYNYILIDCSPSLNFITINALAAADSVIIPVEAAYLSMSGLQQLFKTIGAVRKKINNKLEIGGIVVNRVDSRVNHEKEIIEKLKDSYGSEIKIFDTVMPESVRIEECPAFGVSIFKNEPKGQAAKAYKELINSIVRRKKNGEKTSGQSGV